MFDSIRNDFEGKILHIGDNPISDKKNLIKKNIKSLLVPTLNSIILNSNFSSIYAFNQSIYAKVFIGLIKKKISYIIYKCVKLKKFSIYNLKDFGYIFFSILNFIFSNYLINISKKNKIQKLLLCSREGYFFNQTLNFLKKKNVNIPNYSYFITSRKLSTISAIYNENDIIDSFKKHRFLGLFKDLTQERFNITLSKENIKNSNYLIDTRRDTLKLKMLLKIENDKIINKSLQIRNEYKKYILKQFSNYRIAFVDQGFYGTSQKSIEKIFNRKFFGIYVCLKDKDYYKKCLFDFKNSYFYNHQIFFESLFTGPKGSVININRKGNFIFQKKFKNQKKFDDKRVIFSGMLDFIKDLNKIVNINYHTDNIFLENDCKEIADCLFGLMKKNKKNLSNKILNTFYHDNQFVKKKTYKLNL